MERTIAKYKGDTNIMGEVLEWVAMLATINSGKGVIERFDLLRKLAEKVDDARLQREMLKTVEERVSMLNS